MAKFQIGDTIRCINSEFTYPQLTVNEEYVVKSIRKLNKNSSLTRKFNHLEDEIYLDAISVGWSYRESRFELVKSKEKEKKIMNKVNYIPKKDTILYFHNLSPNDSFKIMNGEAVYRKVKERGSDGEEYMMEETSGLLFSPTSSAVERVNVEVNIYT